ncbi:RNA pyrophosphohydrolase [Candidatus Nitrosacidococcus sp. I8]|uniref:RNA pyrophosphohydrolase n=1 Tax=Candidatus Nitrosacidococcus sp. I8 TaxID=2942908 RepID=UPI002227C1FD|nr:RNA pyrophosphohydrolase [Candidatus Nitrosacidococcus sp. I8]CAH9019234.1 RNA pyrophosphohydrolase [Candidatus Nitrosacidococcus sp. I8]
MIDQDGFRENVGIILCNPDNKVLWARRIKEQAWQFPQGGVKKNETPEEAAYRELEEEIGIKPNHAEIIGCTRNWLHYRLPQHFIRYDNKPLCIGQKQIWYLFRFIGQHQDVQLNFSNVPEFDYWRWVNYWHPLNEIVYFKRKVYHRALNELAPLIFPDYRPFKPRRHYRSLYKYNKR